MDEFFDIGAWLQWFEQLDRTFIFLLLLPFVVAVVGLWAAYRDREVEERDTAESGVDRPRQRTRTQHSHAGGRHRYNQ